jgi:hypothetical protein
MVPGQRTKEALPPDLSSCATYWFFHQVVDPAHYRKSRYSTINLLPLKRVDSLNRFSMQEKASMNQIFFAAFGFFTLVCLLFPSLKHEDNRLTNRSSSAPRK